MPVLYGVLLYMGVSSLKGMQLVDRILLIMMPPKYQPDYPYLRHVPLTKVHIFTLVQVSAKVPFISGIIGLFLNNVIQGVVGGVSLFVAQENCAKVRD